MVAGKQLRLAVETKEERRTRMENDAAILKSWQLCFNHSNLMFLSNNIGTTERNIDHELLSASLILLNNLF